MITKQDIEHVARLMKIEIENPDQYFEHIQKILNYFDTLDQVEISSEEIPIQQTEIEKLREDKYSPSESMIINFLKSYKDNYIRAPKMS